MKKFFTFFVLLVLSIGAQAQVFVPGERVSTIEENTKYFIYNTTYTPGSYPNRWGFVYYDGDVKIYGGAVPESFTTSDESYLFTFTDNGDGTYVLNSVGQGYEVGSYYTLTPWTEAEDDVKGGAQVRNDDGTYTPNADVTEADKVWLIYDGDNSKYWNGNNWGSVGANSFTLWTSGHPYAIYTVVEKTTVSVVYSLFDENGLFIKDQEVQQVPNSPVSIPTELLDGCGYSPLGYNFTPSVETIGESNCDVDVTITLKEGVVTDLAQLSNNKAYTLTTRRGSLGTNETRITTNTTGENIKSFAIIKYGEDYYLYSTEDSKWVKFDGTIAEDMSEDIAENSKLVITTDEVRDEVQPLFFMGIGSNGLNTNGGGHVAVNSFVTRDDGNEFVIIASGEFDPTAALAALESYFNPTCWIDYVVKDEAGNVLFEVKDIPATEGQHITTLPTGYQKNLFYEYSTVDVTVSGIKTTAEFTATQKADAPFQFTTDTTNPVWYNLTIRPDNTNNTGYPTYEQDGDPNVTLPTTLTDDETTQWAFIGTPYIGFQIVNKAAGTDLVLGAENAYDDGNTGGDTWAALGSAGDYTYQTWMVESSTHAPNGFFLYNVVEDAEGNAQNQYLNRRSDANLAYWTGGKDIGSTFAATKVLSGEEKIAKAQKLLDELTEGANEVQIGYPTAEALADFKAEIADIADAYNGDLLEESELSERLNEAIEKVKEVDNVNYTPRTDVYYTITNARGSIVYNPEKAENVDGDENEFLWFTKELDKEDANHQWGVYEKDGTYYLYNVGKQQFANVTFKAAEGKKIFDDGTYKGNWIFSNTPAAMKFDGGDDYEPWVAAPNVRIQGEASETDEDGNEYPGTYTMSISPSYVGPVITYDGINDGGVPMSFAIATTAQDPEVTAAIEKLLDPNGIEVINGQTTVNNGAIYNLQGQKVTKAVKGVYIINNKKVVVK